MLGTAVKGPERRFWTSMPGMRGGVLYSGGDFFVLTLRISLQKVSESRHMVGRLSRLCYIEILVDLLQCLMEL